jgi:hypothetical protein
LAWPSGRHLNRSGIVSDDPDSSSPLLDLSFVADK